MINNINYTRESNALGRPLPGLDYVSGLVAYTSTATQSSYEVLFQASDLSISTDAKMVEAVNDYFRYNPSGKLHVLEAVQDSTYDWAELTLLQNNAKGEIRQALILNEDAIVNTANLSAIHAVAEDLHANNRPLSVIFSGDYSTYSALTDLPNVRVSGQYRTSAVASKDSTKNIDAGAALLGLLSSFKVSENVGYVQNGNITEGTNYQEDNITLVTGESLTTLTDTELEALKTKGYITLRSFTDYAGIYFLDSYTNDLETSDLAFLENVRVLDKVERNTRLSLIPELNNSLVVNSDGSLNEAYISYLAGLCSDTLNLMVNATEISAYKVNINPLQDVVSNSRIDIGLQIQPLAISRFINVNLAFAISV